MRLTRREPAPPVRIVHLGLGAFHRAHQAWYTARATDADEWGIAAFAGRGTVLADRLSRQGGLYTLVERGPDSDAFELVGSIVRAIGGDDATEFVRLLASPEVVILTLTITEAGYRVTPSGLPDLGDPLVAEDVSALRGSLTKPTLEPLPDLHTALGRVILGLEARRRAGGPAIAIVPCDNLPDNGGLIGRALAGFADLVSPSLGDWMRDGVRMVSTSVDRITPRATGDETATVLAATGWLDDAPVVTEPFSDWVLSGEFPSGRPHWESAGARFVDDIEPWELRKLWLLNGAHTLLASTGRLRGHRSVADSITDPDCLSEVEALWDEASSNLAELSPDLDLADYRRALRTRFQNPRIEHNLEQIAQDSLTKLRLRILPVAVRERNAGRAAEACALAVAAWVVADGGAVSVALAGTPLVADSEFLSSVERAESQFRQSVAKPSQS